LGIHLPKIRLPFGQSTRNLYSIALIFALNLEFMINRKEMPVPCYAVIFSYIRSEDLEGYAEMDEATLQEAQQVDGYLGYESTGDGNRRIFISYWRDLESIEVWKKHQLHLRAKSKGKQWYAAFHSMISRVEHSYAHGDF